MDFVDFRGVRNCRVEYFSVQQPAGVVDVNRGVLFKFVFVEGLSGAFVVEAVLEGVNLFPEAA